MTGIWSTASSLAFLVTKLVGVLLTLLVIRSAIWAINMLLIAPSSDPLRNLPGPEGSYWEKQSQQLTDPSKSPDAHEELVAQYGKTWRYQGFGAFDYRLMTFDFRALNHILNSSTYERPWQTRKLLSRVVGHGVFSMEGQEHKWQRKIMAPAFTPQSVRSFSGIFFQKAEELRDCWDKIISSSRSDGKVSYPTPPCTPYPDKAALERTTSQTEMDHVIDIYSWVSKASFDIIGLAGFNYPFNSLQDEPDEVCVAYQKMFRAAETKSKFKILFQLWFPFIETLLPNKNTKIVRASGKKIVENKRAVILAEKSCAKEIQEKDLLSLLIKSNMSQDPFKRMTDTEMIDQLPTFLFAGSDTSSLGISWCIHLLSVHMPVQDRLRQELLSTLSSHGSGAIDTSAIESLPLLDAVIRETLRLCPPVHSTIRVATKDDIIPLSEPIVLRDGTITREIKIRKGSFVHIPIEGLNMNKGIWGNDAHDFNPDRWITGPIPSPHPGLANLMTFSLGGHACPGHKFSILETKIFIATLLLHFVFEPAEKIKKFNSLVTRPYISNSFEKGTKLPVKVSRYCH